MAKLHWNDLETEGKLTYLLGQLKAIKQDLNPLPNPFKQTPTPLDQMIAEKEAQQKEREQKAAYKRIAALEKHRDETDERIKKIMAHGNAVAEQMAALEKMIKTMK